MSIIQCGDLEISKGLFKIKINGIKIPKELIRRPIGFMISSSQSRNKLNVYMGKNKIEVDLSSNTTLFNNVDITDYLESHKPEKEKKSLGEKIQESMLNKIENFCDKLEEKSEKMQEEADKNLSDKKVSKFENKYSKKSTEADNSSKQRDERTL